MRKSLVVIELTTGELELSLPFKNVNCVLKSGLTLQKCVDPSKGGFALKSGGCL